MVRPRPAPAGAAGERGPRARRNASPAVTLCLATETRSPRWVLPPAVHADNDAAGAGPSIDVGRFELAWQPVIELATRRVACVEALLRLRRDDGSLGLPASFLPQAEASGHIVPIGAAALDAACRHAAHWRACGLAGLAVSVNLSTRQLHDARMVDSVSGALARSGLEAAALTLEIGHRTIAADPCASQRAMQRLKKLGVRLVLDDFGTAGWSFTPLRPLPIDGLKIDRRFVHAIPADPDAFWMGQTVLATAATLGLSVVAEAVQTDHQLLTLQRLGCHYAQGYLICPPLRASRLGDFLASARVACGDPPLA